MTDFRDVLADRSSGAAELAVQVALELAEARARGVPARRLVAMGRRAVAAHPAMGSIWNAVHAKDPLAFARGLVRGKATTVRRARALLPRRARIVTLSYSSTVLAVLSRRDFRVTVLESRPGDEGRRTARSLRQRGVDARVVPDSAVSRAVADARVVVVGADAVTRRIVVNKVGTLPLALAARHARVPLFVVADLSKWVPEDWLPPRRALEPLFEAVPRRLVTRIISERR